MKSTAPNTPYGYTIFCDDVRQEVGGKTSHIGIYRAEMFIHARLPAALPKFCFVFHYFERPGESTEPVSLHVYLPGDADNEPTVKTEIPVVAARARKAKRKTPDSDPLIGITGHLVLTPFQLKSEGLIRVRAYRGDLEIRLGTLTVISKPAEDLTPKEAPPTAKKPQPKKAARRKRGRSKKST